MKIFTTFYCILFLVSCACNHDAVEKNYVTPSELNKYPNKYDGMEVYVRGYVLLGTNARSLFESEKRYEEYEKAWDEEDDSKLDQFKFDCITLTEANLLIAHQDSFNKKTMVLHGTFRKNALNTPIIDLQACSDSFIRLENDDVRKMLKKQ